MTDPDSHQARACQWLESDPCRIQNLCSEARLGHRFALACICCATRCDVDWERADGWLFYEVHECDWLSRGGFGLESFPNRQALIQALTDFAHFLGTANRTEFVEWEQTLSSFNQSRTCNEDELHKNLFLCKMNLVGSMPPELCCHLTNLESLDLTLNMELGGSMSPDIQRLTNLQFLWLGHNSFTGSLPATLGNLLSLQTLDIVATRVTGSIPSQIGRLTNLAFLSLTKSLLSSTIQEELSCLRHLNDFEMSHSHVTGAVPSSRGLLSDLRSLQMNDGNLTGPVPSELRNLRNLVLFELRDNQLTGSMQINILKSNAFLLPFVQHNAMKKCIHLLLPFLKMTRLRTHDIEDDNIQLLFASLLSPNADLMSHSLLDCFF